ncbi:tellurite resistance TerB family protein [Kushneria sp. Sum13]|uniref:tellurite resistance TerB family protein n=1 Tax=Kushneria sp. Sum13 TaxID=3459196 RepID=UPI0040461AF8
MLDTINEFFERLSARSPSDRDHEMTLELAVAALMCEVMRADGEMKAAEQQTLREMLKRRFDLEESAVEVLVDMAHQQVEDSVDHYQFVRLIREEYDYPQRVALIGRLWRVAYADGVLDPLEEARVRKLAELLYVEHADFIMQKLEVQESLGLA